ncbi:MAG: hypothetical protein H0U76_15210 [Ktedonobacteraceae bacterium]|nr:hypothetical protein [Ktedonobacteraceae bacterium]
MITPLRLKPVCAQSIGAFASQKGLMMFGNAVSVHSTNRLVIILARSN